MTNTVAPQGLKFVRRMDGASPNIALREALIAVTNTTKIFKGSLIKLLNTGFIDLAVPTDDASNGVFGVFDSVEWFDSSVKQKRRSKYWDGNANGVTGTIKALIHVDPMNLYVIQSNGIAIAQTHIGNNTRITAEAGNIYTGLSTEALDISNVGTTAAQFPLRIEGIANVAGVDPTLANNYAEVRIINTLVNNTTGI